jgi:pimeloyl-ACP methyl ester carboxylesterase
MSMPARALFLLAIMSACIYAQTNTPPMLGKLVDAGGYRVHLYCTGQGRPTAIVASGGFSFDWGLIQPEIAKYTRICTYDPAGSAWSDRVPGHSHPTCNERVDELYHLLENAGEHGPYVLVGYSIGGLVARLYAARHSDEVAGMVIVDHAFIDTPKTPNTSPMQGVDSPPVLIYRAPIVLDMEDDENFSRLPERNQQLHRWALTNSLRPTPEMAAVCFDEVEHAEKAPYPLGNRPLAVVSTSYDSAQYRKLQQQVLNLSRDHVQLMAENSTHMVIIDQPEVVTAAIRKVVAASKVPH